MMKLMMTMITTLLLSCSAFAAGTWNGIFKGDLKNETGHCDAELEFTQQGNYIRLQSFCNYEEPGNPIVRVEFIANGDFLIDGFDLVTQDPMTGQMFRCGEISLFTFRCGRVQGFFEITHDGNGNFHVKAKNHGITISGPLTKSPLK